MGYVTVTQDIDLLQHIERNIEVEVEVDTDDVIADMDADELVDALTGRESYSEIASRIYDACDGMETAMAEHENASALARRIVEEQTDNFIENMRENCTQEFCAKVGTALIGGVEVVKATPEDKPAAEPAPEAKAAPFPGFATAAAIVQAQSDSSFTVRETMREYLNEYGVDHMLAAFRVAVLEHVSDAFAKSASETK